jgi:hypothetical protein
MSDMIPNLLWRASFVLSGDSGVVVSDRASQREALYHLRVPKAPATKKAPSRARIGSASSHGAMGLIQRNP